MKVIQNIIVDLAQNGGVTYADAAQGDSARYLRMILEENGSAWKVPEDVVVAVRYVKPDGTGGTYDTLPDGTPAGVAQGNILLLGLAPQVCAVAGKIHLQIVLIKKDVQVSSFAMVLRVEESVKYEEESVAYINLSAWLQQNRGKDGKDGENGQNGKQGEPGKDGYTPIKGVDYYTEEERKNVVNEVKAEIKSDFAAAIVHNAIGDSILLADSAEQKIRGLKLYGKSTQDGTPTPENPVEIVHAGADGSITVAIDGSQFITALTPKGLLGVKVPSGGNYTDSGGQQWLCDEVDFGRGVYTKWVFEYTPSFEASSIGRQTNYDGDGWFGWFISDSAITACGNVRNNNPGYSTHFVASGSNPPSGVNQFRLWGTMGYLLFTLDTDDAQTAADIINSATFYLALETPIEMPLTEEEKAQFAALYTNYPTTTVLNDEGVGMEVIYMTDTKNYIDKKLSDLEALILQK